MKEAFVNPFLSPAVAVWEKELHRPLTFAGVQAISHQHTTHDVTAVIGVTGNLRGTVLYEFSHETAKAIAAAMIGEPVPELDAMSMSALGELANMITGNAATLLAHAGYPCDISPPLIIAPKGAALTLTSQAQLQVLFTSDLGPVMIRVGLAEAGEEQARPFRTTESVA